MTRAGTAPDEAVPAAMLRSPKNGVDAAHAPERARGASGTNQETAGGARDRVAAQGNSGSGAW